MSHTRITVDTFPTEAPETLVHDYGFRWTERSTNQHFVARVTDVGEVEAKDQFALTVSGMLAEMFEQVSWKNTYQEINEEAELIFFLHGEVGLPAIPAHSDFDDEDEDDFE